MVRQWPTMCALVLALCAYVHFDTAFAAVTNGKEFSPSPGKPGICPKQSWGMGMCAEFCSRDSDCPNNEKCCSNGCGHQCMAPYTVKHGRCPLPQGTPMCAEFCYHDGQCPGEQKCCRTSCGHACTDPCH